MKKVYFVRHGESEGNISGKSQNEFAKLTENGKKQAAFVADRFSRIDVDVVICSSVDRAIETGNFISNKINKSLEISDLFIERKRPREQENLERDKDPVWLEIEKQIKDNFDNNSFRFSDEENLQDLKDRAKKCFDFLQNRTEDNILVVTHGVFMRFLIAYATLGDDLTAESCNNFFRVFNATNTGLSVFGFDEKRIDRGWFLHTWNDFSHLG